MGYNADVPDIVNSGIVRGRGCPGTKTPVTWVSGAELDFYGVADEAKQMPMAVTARVGLGRCEHSRSQDVCCADSSVLSRLVKWLCYAPLDHQKGVAYFVLAAPRTIK